MFVGEFTTMVDFPTFAILKTPLDTFIRGDANVDGAFDISDPVTTLNVLFAGGSASCEVALDGNDDDAVDVSDVIYVLSNLFGTGPPPPSPFPDCGADPSAGSLSCDSFSICP